MGEYALHRGERVKIGTCEAMYYLRADQVDEVSPELGNVDPAGADRKSLLFRFPFPAEDGIAPGAFDSAWGRGFTVRGVSVPDGVDHGIMQFTSQAGYLLNLPCPEGPDLPEGLALHKNGYGGAVRLVAQRYWDGSLVGVCECKGCGHLYRMPTLADAAPVLEAIAAMAVEQDRTADRYPEATGHRAIAVEYREIYRRLASGYREAQVA